MGSRGNHLDTNFFHVYIHMQNFPHSIFVNIHGLSYHSDSLIVIFSNHLADFFYIFFDSWRGRSTRAFIIFNVSSLDLLYHSNTIRQHVRLSKHLKTFQHSITVFPILLKIVNLHMPQLLNFALFQHITENITALNDDSQSTNWLRELIFCLLYTSRCV